MLVNRKLIFIIAVGGFLSFFNLSAHAQVLSMFEDTVVSQEDGSSLIVVQVRCSGRSALRSIVFDSVGEGQWCSKDLPGQFCRNKKLSAATEICSARYTSQLKEYKATQEQQKVALKAELERQQQKIRQQLLALEKRKADLLKRDKVLQNQESKLKSQLAGR